MVGLVFARSFRVPVWDEETRERAIDYWSRRGVVFYRVDDGALTGRRGSLWANPWTFDMRKVEATLTIGIAGVTVRCTLDVNTAFQLISAWNRSWLEFEMDTFESYLLHGDEQEAEWARFAADYWQAQRTVLLTGGLTGRKMPPEKRPAVPTELLAASAPGGSGTELEAAQRGTELISSDAPGGSGEP